LYKRKIKQDNILKDEINLKQNFNEHSEENAERDTSKNNPFIRPNSTQLY